MIRGCPRVGKPLRLDGNCLRDIYGDKGFLTEGIDWDNVVGSQHHASGAQFGAIQYTEPLLNNLHIVEPTLNYLERWAIRRTLKDGRTEFYDHEGNLLATLKPTGAAEP